MRLPFIVSTDRRHKGTINALAAEGKLTPHLIVHKDTRVPVAIANCLSVALDWKRDRPEHEEFYRAHDEIPVEYDPITGSYTVKHDYTERQPG